MAKQKTYREIFSVGDRVEIQQAPLDGETRPQWLAGRVQAMATGVG